MADHTLRFADASLQQRFVSLLEKNGIAYELNSDGAVESSEAQWPAVNAAAHSIRDGCFRWYLSWFDKLRDSDDFLAAVRRSGLPCQVEHRKNRMVFLLAKAHENEYDQLMAAVMARRAGTGGV